MTKTLEAAKAKWIAAARAKETGREDCLLSAPYPTSLVRKIRSETVTRSEQEASGENRLLPVQTRYFDDTLLDTAGKVRQVVILGAGYDTRAFWLPLQSELRIFELDLPEVLAEKKASLASLRAVPRCHLRYVPTNFCDDWADDLLTAGFHTGDPTLWIAEDLFFYMTQLEVELLLNNSRRLTAPRSFFVADCSGTGILRQADIQPYLKWLELRGEPLPFCHDKPAELFKSCGWKRVRVLRPGQSEVNDGRFSLLKGKASIVKAQTYLVRAEC
jgi:methyltransferase (TIGR00027 family)